MTRCSSVRELKSKNLTHTHIDQRDWQNYRRCETTEEEKHMQKKEHSVNSLKLSPLKGIQQLLVGRAARQEFDS